MKLSRALCAITIWRRERMSKFSYTDIDAIKASKNRTSCAIDLNALYKQAHSELSLQQTKRDQIISLYLGLCTLIVPIILSTSYIEWLYKGIIFLVLGLIGFLLSVIVIRYKVYKDVYWICCQTISQLTNYPVEDIDKPLVQGLFYGVIQKRGGKFVAQKKQKCVFRNFRFLKRNLFSAEALLYIALILIVSIVAGLGLGLTCNQTVLINAIIGVCFGLVLFLFLLWQFFRQSKKIYKVLVDGQDDSFNHVFSKAWFLHFYE